MGMRLPSTLDIANEDVRDLLCEATTSTDVVLDGSGVCKVDAAGLQLLCAFVAAVNRRGGRVTWQAPSAQLLQAARILRVSGYLGFTDSTAQKEN